jgi:hypothetical protein
MVSRGTRPSKDADSAVAVNCAIAFSDSALYRSPHGKDVNKMAKAVFAIAMILLFGNAAWADSLSCASMLSLGSQSAPRPLIVRMRLEIGLQWSRATGKPLANEDFDQIIVACVDDPSSSIQDVVQTLLTPKPVIASTACSR